MSENKHRRVGEPPSDDDNDGSRTFGPTEQQTVERFTGRLRTSFRDLDQLAESCESSLPPELAHRIRERRQAANESIELELVTVVIDPLQLLSRQAVESIPQALFDTEVIIEGIQHLAQVVLEVAPDTRSMAISLAEVAPRRVREISVEANETISELEEFVIEIIGEAYYVSGLMLPHVGLLPGVDYR